MKNNFGTSIMIWGERWENPWLSACCCRPSNLNLESMFRTWPHSWVFNVQIRRLEDVSWIYSPKRLSPKDNSWLVRKSLREKLERVVTTVARRREMGVCVSWGCGDEFKCWTSCSSPTPATHWEHNQPINIIGRYLKDQKNMMPIYRFFIKLDAMHTCRTVNSMLETSVTSYPTCEQHVGSICHQL